MKIILKIYKKSIKVTKLMMNSQFRLWLLNWKSPYTYPIMFIILMTSTYILLSCCKCIISLFIGLSVVFITFTKDMELELQTLKENEKTDGNVQRFRDFVQFHAHIKKYGKLFWVLIITLSIFTTFLNCFSYLLN